MKEARSAAHLGSTLVAAGVLLPWVDFGREYNGWWSLLDFSDPAYSFPFAIEPLAVAVAAPFLASRASRKVAIMLTTIGAQTLLMFGGMAFGPLFGGYGAGPGGPVGMLGAASIGAAGLLLLAGDEVPGVAGEPPWDGVSSADPNG